METTKNYELRKLASKDVFPMFRIISKIGVKEFKQCFESENVQKAMKNVGEMEEESLKSIGLTVMLDVATVVISHIGDADNEIYTFLSGLSGMTRTELENLDMGTFFEMIFDVFRKEEFKDFIGVVSRLFK